MEEPLPPQIALLIGTMNRLTPQARNDAVRLFSDAWGSLDGEHLPTVALTCDSIDRSGAAVVLAGILSSTHVRIDLAFRSDGRILGPGWDVTVEGGLVRMDEDHDTRTVDLARQRRRSAESLRTMEAIASARELMRTIPMFAG